MVYGKPVKQLATNQKFEIDPLISVMIPLPKSIDQRYRLQYTMTVWTKNKE